jgi:branched-chain amino acid transport system ATP-binding protein
MANDCLCVSNVESGYGDVQVLRNVSFHIAKGEAVCLVGSNGSGKSTLLRTLSGLLKCSGGGVRFNGSDLTNKSPKAILSAGIAHVQRGGVCSHR